MTTLTFDERQGLVEKFYPSVLELARNMSRHVPRGIDESDILSLADEVAIDCRDNYSSDDPSTFQNYLFRSLRNRVIDFLRRRKSRNGITRGKNYHPTVSLETTTTSSDGESIMTYDPVDFRELPVGTEMEVREEWELLRRRVGTSAFPSFHLRYVQGMSYGEIGRVLGLTSRVAQNRVIEARRTIRLWLSGYEDEEDFYARRSLASASTE